MPFLHEIVAYHLNELRDELRNAQLTDSRGISATAESYVGAIRLLIAATPEQSAALHAIVADFESIHQAVQRFGPDPRQAQIRRAFEAARASIDATDRALASPKPSRKAIEMGIAPAP
jgi:hypothetical protein